MGKHTHEMKTHWVADAYPLNNEDVEALANDIKTNGQITPIKALKDGRIIDGRNRFLACRMAGVEPVIEVVNPDGEEVSDERAFAIATSCNSMRRDLTTSLRACLAAEAWKRLYPEEVRGGDVRAKSKTHGSWVSFRQFASTNFKAGINTAEQALAILNHDPSGELLEQAKGGLAAVYAIYQQEKVQRLRDREETELLDKYPDLREDVANGRSREEALVVARHRDRDRLELEEAEKRAKKDVVRGIRAFQETVYRTADLDPAEVREWMDDEGFAGMSEGKDAERQTLERGIKLLVGILQNTK